jgi:hypothetical protein
LNDAGGRQGRRRRGDPPLVGPPLPKNQPPPSQKHNTPPPAVPPSPPTPSTTPQQIEPPAEDHPLKPLAEALRNKVDQADAKVIGGAAAACRTGCCPDDAGVGRYDYFRAKDAVRAMVADPQAFGLFEQLARQAGGADEDEEEEEGAEEVEAEGEGEGGKSGGGGGGKSGTNTKRPISAATAAALLPSDDPAKAQAMLAAAANEALGRLVRAGLLFRAERRFKKPKPGRKRRAKWPRTLVPLGLGEGPRGAVRASPMLAPEALTDIFKVAEVVEAAEGEQQGGAKSSSGGSAKKGGSDKKAKTAPAAPSLHPDADTFYVWAYDRPTSWLFYAGAAALLLGCAAVPLYPLAPHPVRLAVLYLLLALLTVIVGTVAVRGVVFSFVWILTGYSLWLLPNLLSEEVPLSQVLKPYVTLKAPKNVADGRKRALRVAARVAAGAAVLGVGALLARHGPSGGELRKAAGEANDALLAYMETMAGGAARLHNGTDTSKQAPAGKGAGAAAGGGAAGKGFGSARAAPPPPPPPPEEEEEDVEEEEPAEDKFDDARQEAEEEGKKDEL